MQTFDILVRGGLVVTGSDIAQADVGIKGEKITAVSPGLDDDQAQKVINADGKYVFPGLFDVHTHPVYTDDMGELSRVAAYGGITTLIHYAYVKPGQEVLPTLKIFREEGLSKSVLDFALHAGLFDVENQLADVPAAFNMGVTSFKVFMTYAKLKWMTDDYWLTTLADVVAQEKGLLMVHAENGLVTDYLEDKILREGRDPVKNFMLVCPDLLEAEAINRAVTISQLMGSALYIVHNSAAACLQPLRRAKAEGITVIGETCPQYLTLNDETTQKFKAQAKMGPPLRTKVDNEALWEGLADGTLSTIASDHAPKAKRIEDDFVLAPFGGPQTESMVVMAYHEGVNKGRITLPRFVELFSENPARIWGMYPKKGIIAVGSDADLVIFDPTYSWKISAENQHSNAGFTLYEGRDVMGKPVLTMQRGEIILENGSIVAKPYRARHLSTDTSHLYE
jgi:dihydropyrimidinase